MGSAVQKLKGEASTLPLVKTLGDALTTGDRLVLLCELEDVSDDATSLAGLGLTANFLDRSGIQRDAGRVGSL